VGFKVNFSGVEVRDFSEPVPVGWYHMKVTDGEVRESGPNAKNPGAEYINWEMTIQEGEYENRKGWVNASLLPHALFTLKGLLGACGIDVSGDLDFEIHDVVGRDLLAKATIVPRRTKEGAVVDGEFQNEWKSFKEYSGDIPSSQADSLLPG